MSQSLRSKTGFGCANWGYVFRAICMNWSVQLVVTDRNTCLLSLWATIRPESSGSIMLLKFPGLILHYRWRLQIARFRARFALWESLRHVVLFLLRCGIRVGIIRSKVFADVQVVRILLLHATDISVRLLFWLVWWDGRASILMWCVMAPQSAVLSGSVGMHARVLFMRLLWVLARRSLSSCSLVSMDVGLRCLQVRAVLSSTALSHLLPWLEAYLCLEIRLSCCFSRAADDRVSHLGLVWVELRHFWVIPRGMNYGWIGDLYLGFWIMLLLPWIANDLTRLQLMLSYIDEWLPLISFSLSIIGSTTHLPDLLELSRSNQHWSCLTAILIWILAHIHSFLYDDAEWTLSSSSLIVLHHLVVMRLAWAWDLEALPTSMVTLQGGILPAEPSSDSCHVALRSSSNNFIMRSALANPANAILSVSHVILRHSCSRRTCVSWVIARASRLRWEVVALLECLQRVHVVEPVVGVVDDLANVIDVIHEMMWSIFGERWLGKVWCHLSWLWCVARDVVSNGFLLCRFLEAVKGRFKPQTDVI